MFKTIFNLKYIFANFYIPIIVRVYNVSGAGILLNIVDIVTNRQILKLTDATQIITAKNYEKHTSQSFNGTNSIFQTFDNTIIPFKAGWKVNCFLFCINKVQHNSFQNIYPDKIVTRNFSI